MKDKLENKPHDLQPIIERLVDSADENWPENKWSFLYSYARKALDEEIDRFKRMDEKSVKLLSSVSIIITIFIALFKWVVDDNELNYSYYLYIISFLLFTSLCTAWFFFFSALKLQLTPRMPLDDSIFSLVKEKNMASIHVALYKACQNALNLSRDAVEGKAKKLKRGYTATSFAAVFLVVFIAMILFESKVEISTNIQTTEEIKMPDNEQKNEAPQQTGNEPDLDITAPEIVFVTDSADTHINKNGSIILESED